MNDPGTLVSNLAEPASAVDWGINERAKQKLRNEANSSCFSSPRFVAALKSAQHFRIRGLQYLHSSP